MVALACDLDFFAACKTAILSAIVLPVRYITEARNVRAFSDVFVFYHFSIPSNSPEFLYDKPVQLSTDCVLICWHPRQRRHCCFLPPGYGEARSYFGGKCLNRLCTSLPSFLVFLSGLEESVSLATPRQIRLFEWASNKSTTRVPT